MRTTILATTLAISAFSGFASAQTTAEQIRAAALRFLDGFASEQASEGYRVSYESGQLDDRIALAQCDSDLEVQFSGDPWKSTHPSLQVSCEGERPWRMFITPEVTIHGPALVSTRALARGESLSASMVTTQSVVVNASRRGVTRQLSDIEGMDIRRGINAGTLITPDMLSAPNAVERGDHVIIVARSGAFSVSSRGEALASASVGEQVRVRNLRSERTIRANVIAPGRVEIPM